MRLGIGQLTGLIIILEVISSILLLVGFRRDSNHDIIAIPAVGLLLIAVVSYFLAVRIDAHFYDSFHFIDCLRGPVAGEPLCFFEEPGLLAVRVPVY